MVIDKQIHKEVLLKILEATNIPGQLLDVVYEIKQAILKAEIGKNPLMDKNPLP